MIPKSMLGGYKEKTMKTRIILSLLIFLTVGCKTEKPTDNGDRPQPIVSPTNITETVQDSSDPILPHLIPWWAKEK